MEKLSNILEQIVRTEDTDQDCPSCGKEKLRSYNGHVMPECAVCAGKRQRVEAEHQATLARPTAVLEKYRRMDWQDYILTQDRQAHALKTAKKYAEDFSSELKDRKFACQWLMLFGGRGCGKTMLANLICKQAERAGAIVLNQTSHEIYGELKRAREQGQDGERGYFERIAAKNLIIINELGNTNRSDDEKNFWREFTDLLYRKNKWLVIATNLKPFPSGNENHVGDYIEIDRLVEMTEGKRRMVFFDWESFRMKAWE